LNGRWITFVLLFAGCCRTRSISSPWWLVQFQKKAIFEKTFKFQILKLSETTTHLKFPKTEQKEFKCKKKMFPLPRHIIVVKSHHFNVLRSKVKREGAKLKTKEDTHTSKDITTINNQKKSDEKRAVWLLPGVSSLTTTTTDDCE
jgi:hypothetical protein